MTLRVTFELSDEDLAHFAGILKKTASLDVNSAKKDILNAARRLLIQASQANVPSFMQRRMERLDLLIRMIEDEEWNLPEQDAYRVLQALAYFSEPEDLIPDNVPALGFLDDAIMVELVSRGLKPEIGAYEDFLVFQENSRKEKPEDSNAATRTAWLTKRREDLHTRMHRQRRRERSGGPMKALMGLFAR